jgi:hypothetical protein
MFGDLGESPIPLHFGMQEILVDCREFARQLLVEQFQNVCVALHVAPKHLEGLVELDWFRARLNLVQEPDGSAPYGLRHACFQRFRQGSPDVGPQISHPAWTGYAK